MIPTAAGHSKVCCAGCVYRYQEELAGGPHRWKRPMGCKAMARRDFLQTDAKGHGMRAIYQGTHCDRFKPSPTTERVEAMRRQIIRDREKVNAPEPRMIPGASGELA